ncbi:aspartyl protease family protein [Flavobacteriaceae bacterium S356]|uniref:Aspartyl protease family protein n=1 Tax=Asprobacillus argus TaxID=3076534 RepID=A0ABU3LC18_9FLAO|nr:aspartyl protease family protein [Flavobacteriaceae bacterium S356]
MSAIRKSFIFLFVISFWGATYAQSFQDTIPFRNDLGLIIIPITFNGVEKQFAFDTGAEHTVAYGWAKETLKRTNKTITINSSSGLKSRMRFYKSGTIELGSRKITGHRILNTKNNSIFSCYRIDGILGVDIIKKLNWSIDYKNKRLIMYPSNHVPPQVKNMHELDFDFRSNRPYVYLKGKSNRLRFLLDTGAGGSSNISKRNYTLSNIKDYPQTSFYTGSFDINGTLTSSHPIVFKFPKASSDKVTLSPIIYYNNKKSTKIGNRLWDQKQLFLSLQNDQLYLSSAEVTQQYSSYSCSVMYRKGKMRIMAIEENSELWNMGVRQGDEILRYNGKQFSDFCSLDQYYRKVVSSGKPFELELVSGKKVTVSKKAFLK